MITDDRLRELVGQLAICPTCNCDWRASPPATILSSPGRPTGQVRCVHCKAVYDDPQTITSIVTELLSRREADAWQPIETAPKDGNYVLVSSPWPMTRVEKARWIGPPHNHWTVDGFRAVDKATHWHPLPQPPQGSTP